MFSTGSLYSESFKEPVSTRKNQPISSGSNYMIQKKHKPIKELIERFKEDAN